ncbi:hypothetical protein K435DRAFT_813924 [Dendrothele bispora CBS 962.96]|uniref:Uncharacterized protein n=1 Tax=Dendrothele bispora (strain CBS 962.96) TaxID=1314807 RepID=A0A4S8KKD3_DENBC|nr:hypothetical protein K435DRAFT_813924 [Dendrothele bispora CBS 962.96]
MEIQARIPASLAALHNFIMDNDTENFLPDFRSDIDATDPNPGQHIEAHDAPFINPQGELANGLVTEQEYAEALKRRDEIAEAMWLQYQEVLQTRADEEVDQYLELEDGIYEGSDGEGEGEDNGEVE